MSDPEILAGHRIVERIEHVGAGTRRRRITAWTLHLDDCTYMLRGRKTALPAPVTPYPNTIDCTVCAPNGEHRRGKPVQADDGTWSATCRCGLSVTGSPSEEAARNALGRRHTAPASTRPRGEPVPAAHKVKTTMGAREATARCSCGESRSAASPAAARSRLYRAHRREVLHRKETT